MNRQKLSLLGSAGVGAGLGAGLMYLLDPQGGGRRRAVARNKTVSALKTGGSACLKTGKDLGNRTKGLISEAGSKLRRETVDDRVVSDRVRSKMGRAVSNPSAVEVTAIDGLVILSGPVLASEKDELLAVVSKVKGVRDVDDQLEVHEHRGDNPSLQGNGRTGSRLARAWKPATLILAGTAGSALAIAGFKRRDKVGAALGAAGLGVLASSFTRRSGRGDDRRELGGDGSVGLDSSLRTGARPVGVRDLESGSLESALSEDRELQTTLP